MAIKCDEEALKCNLAKMAVILNFMHNVMFKVLT